MIDVLLVSMPFGPLFSPSLGLSLLQPQVVARGLTCRIDYFTLPFAERIGERLYSKIASQHRAMSRAFVGEWIFSHALFDWDAAARRALPRRRAAEAAVVARAQPDEAAGAGRDAGDPRGARRRRARSSTGAPIASRRREPRIVGLTSVFQQHLASLALAKRLKARLPGTCIVIGGANCEATMGVETVRQFPFVDAVVSGEGDHIFAELALPGHPASAPIDRICPA